MKNRQSWILKRAAAMLIALMLLFSAVPAAVAASPDWSQLVITISWYDAGTGETRSLNAEPVWDAEGNFWIMLPQDAPFDGLTISVIHPAHNYMISPAEGETLYGVSIAGDTMDGMSYIPISATDPDTGVTETFCLYISITVSQPVTDSSAEDPEEAARRAAEEEALRLQEEEQRRQQE
ncbi:MAG: hypothetical protein J6Y48_17460, partial [Clostridia bacterium]|nr:hypothetical protein [Clostridia bacterium]